MYFLSYIKDPIPLLLIGGISGIGKTSIIDSLLDQFSEHFQQPLSYTSRKRRSDTDRYIFTSKDEIIKLYDSGELLNLDNAYNHLYGMSKRHIFEIKKHGKIPLKEVHPSNFKKIKEADSSVITILIENKHLSEESNRYVEREGRKNDEENWSTNSDEIDIVLNIAGLTPEQAAHFLIKKLFAFRRHQKRLPHPGIIDNTNAKGYTKIAQEFTESKRITTKNFHDASKPFWETFFENHFPLKKNIYPNLLEIGPGNGWLLNTVKIRDAHIYGVDISGNMKADYVRHKSISSARSMPYETEFFDYIVASLADPYLYPEVIVEIARLLKKGGFFAFTYPSSYWANNLPGRSRKNKTIFIDQNNHEIEVFSICHGIEDLYEMFLLSKLEVIMTTELYLQENYEDEISSAISDSATFANKDIFSMPIVIGGVFQKG